MPGELPHDCHGWICGEGGRWTDGVESLVLYACGPDVGVGVFEGGGCGVRQSWEDPEGENVARIALNCCASDHFPNLERSLPGMSIPLVRSSRQIAALSAWHGYSIQCRRSGVSLSQSTSLPFSSLHLHQKVQGRPLPLQTSLVFLNPILPSPASPHLFVSCSLMTLLHRLTSTVFLPFLCSFNPSSFRSK